MTKKSVGMLASWEAVRGNPQTCPGGIREGSSEKAMRSIAKLKCLSTDVHSMGNKQEELEAVVQLGKCYLIAITETWWDESHDGNTLRITGFSEGIDGVGGVVKLPSMLGSG